jgi:hypothetical protein
LRSSRLGAASVLAYLLALVTIEVLRRAGTLSASSLAATPAAIAAGKSWLLLTSAFAFSGPAVLELAGLALAVFLFVRQAGPGTFWLVGGVSHIGATLLVYAGVGILWLVARDGVEGIVDKPDFGVSAVWLGVLGAIFAGCAQSLRRGEGGPRERLLAGLCLAAAVIGFVFFSLLPGSEHAVAFLLGALVAWLLGESFRVPSLGTRSAE